MQISIKSGVIMFIVVVICLLIYMHIVIEHEACNHIDVPTYNEPVKDVKHVEKIIDDYMKRKHKHNHRSEIIEDMRYSAIEGFIGGMFLSGNMESSLLSSVVYSLMGGFTSTYKLYKDINHVKN
jgi:hypothetical protein